LTFTDARDKQLYHSVKIGEQTWMAENLNYDANTTGSVCYDNKPANCDQYGRLYNWETAMKACPSGWHLPSNDEWQELVGLAGGNKHLPSDDKCEDCTKMPPIDNGSYIAEKKLKATSGWSYYDNGTDDYGFSALPGGYGDPDGYFCDGGLRGYWWSSSDTKNGYSYIPSMYYLYSNNSSRNSELYSIRCLQD